MLYLDLPWISRSSVHLMRFVCCFLYAVIEELLTLESVSKIIDTHKKDTNKLQPSVNTTTMNTGKA